MTLPAQLRRLPVNTPVLLPNDPSSRIQLVSPDAPAHIAMTDFRAAPVVTTRSDSSISDALAQMKQSGARFAFVLGAHDDLVGSITSYDIQSEKPMQYMTAIGCSETTCAWRDVAVDNIMEPLSAWQVLDYAQVVRMTVAEVAETLQLAGMRYLVVVEVGHQPGARQIRGLFSMARLHALLGRLPATSIVPRGMTSLMAANSVLTATAA
jgi:CBS-domain-containing membrane protein